MTVNTRFSVACHVLTLLELERGQVITSDIVARSVNTSPVVIRRLFCSLKAAELILVRPGTGGTSLSRPAEEITLLDVYHAVGTERGALFRLHGETNPKCYIGRNIHDALSAPLLAADEAMKAALAQNTIAELAAFIDRRHPARSGRTKTAL